MVADPIYIDKIKKAFEIADDEMQGIIGYFHYVKACQNLAPQDKIIPKLPRLQDQNTREFKYGIQITNDWVRLYDPKNLCQTMQQIFLCYHTWVALISLISIFEGALKNFIETLKTAGTIPKKISKPKKDNYKSRLEWTFKIASQSEYGTNIMKNRIPNLCIQIDHARRIRNLWVHNRGFFDKGYQNAINVNGQQPIISSQFTQFLKNKNTPVLFILDPSDFEVFSCSHIELLHHLQDTVQKKYFGQKECYNYETEKKKIEWQRLLQGS